MCIAVPAFADITGVYESIAFVEEGELISEYLTLTIRIAHGAYQFTIYVDGETMNPVYAPLTNPISKDDRHWVYIEDQPWVLESYLLEDHLILYYAGERSPAPDLFIILRKTEL
jgi:hypothetical protein